MKSIGLRFAIAAIFLLFARTPAVAVTTDGTALTIVIPVVSSSGSYSSKVHVLNVDAYSASVDIYYTGAGESPSLGTRFCGTLSVPSGQTGNFDFAIQCGVNPAAGSNRGMMRLYSNAYINAYSRISNPQGNGFSVEGYPIGNFFGYRLSVLGARKSAISPGYQTNCFVGSLEEAANYSIKLFQSNGTQIGSTIVGAIGANDLKRYLDIFAAAGVVSSELSDVTVEITSTDANLPALVAFCTVQNNTSFDADFRIAKSRWGSGDSSVKYVDGASPFSPFTTWVKHRYIAVLKAPDIVGCSINPPYDTVLEMQLLGPNGVIWAGGNGVSSFNVVIGPKSAVAGGTDQSWVLEISPREFSQFYPIYYTFNCYAGNGMSRPNQLVDGPDDF